MKPALLLVGVLAAVSCGPKKAAVPERTCTVTGQVVRLDPQVRTAVIKHEKICDWMGAMTMEFPVRDSKDFQRLQTGAKITATVHIGDPEFWISNVQPAQ